MSASAPAAAAAVTAASRRLELDPPETGAAVEIAEGVLWARLPLPFKGLPVINVYALDEGDGWTLVDTGLDWEAGRAALAALLAGPLAGRPVTRVILTHHHPDHIGQAGRLAATGAELLASRTAWLFGRMLTLDAQERPPEEAIRFRRRAGLDADQLAAFVAERPFNFADTVAPIPLGFRALAEGDRLAAGGRDWRVRIGQGHAPDHVTLWSEDGALMLAGDQILPAISPNIGVYPTEPEADPLTGFLDTCARFRALGEAGADPLVLPGHQRPFRGVGRRAGTLIEGHAQALTRIEAALAEAPRSAVGLFGAIYRRPIAAAETGLALAEAVAHCNYLWHSGRVSRSLSAEGAWLYALEEAA
ncbi:MBL fold metallo-hydrolase [Paralimibaculum aggregatum]|uniref:MBL fold metallo-hydrolase n=1 Tax=Paralimibaculum aggregatum TaxID=3036245 RepID=A0ABQ6LKP9_9RHOB|nr:MBL fold metallo-hydrolase [Limibaculum sp. NKW23]GMG81808.1 MBL fold metallo-hydrolase [Limibaculum sp. NKW23]